MTPSFAVCLLLLTHIHDLKKTWINHDTLQHMDPITDAFERIVSVLKNLAQVRTCAIFAD